MTEALPPPSSDEPSMAPPEWVRWAVLVLSLVSASALWLAWSVQKKVQTFEPELVRRQQDTQSQAAEARLLSHQAQDISREAAARTAVLESRLAEIAGQRGQLDDLLKSLSASRDETLVSDLEGNVRVALQQATLTGSAAPLVAALQGADARLGRAHQPRLDGVRRAIAKDLDRLRATPVADLAALTVRLDQGIQLVDELVLLSQPVDANGRALARPAAAAVPAPTATRKPARATHAAATPPPPERAPPDLTERILDWSHGAARAVWQEVHSLVRITRIRQPDAILISPDQAFFVRENLKLRLLNARLALLSRQPSAAIADLQTAEQTVAKYFDPQSRKTPLLQSLLADVAAQSAHLSIPRPDDTLSALTAAGAR